MAFFKTTYRLGQVKQPVTCGQAVLSLKGMFQTGFMILSTLVSKDLNQPTEAESRRKQYYKDYYQRNKDRILDYNKVWQSENRDKVNGYRKKRKDSLNSYKREYDRNYPEKFLFTEARKRAKEKGLPFSIEVSDIVIPEHCPILGITLEKGEGPAVDGSPSIDKIVPNLGYVKGNIQVISKKANIMKSNATKEELIMFAKWIQKEFSDEYS